MQDVGIHDTDVLIVDRSLDPGDGDVVVAIVEGDFTVQRFRRQSAKTTTLTNDNSRVPPCTRGRPHLYVGLGTAEHSIDLPQHSPGTTIRFVEPTKDTLTLCAAAGGLRRIWRDGYSYYRAGVLMDDLVAVERAPRAWVVEHDRERRERLMRALDGLNARFGRRTIFLAGAGIRQGWSTKAGQRSASFTTRLEQLPVAQA